jgi:hypothetical protein
MASYVGFAGTTPPGDSLYEPLKVPARMIALERVSPDGGRTFGCPARYRVELIAELSSDQIERCTNHPLGMAHVPLEVILPALPKPKSPGERLRELHVANMHKGHVYPCAWLSVPDARRDAWEATAKAVGFK